MGDSGEGLVDANSRVEERIEETKESQRIVGREKAQPDPERIRTLESLRLTKVDLERQLSRTTHQVRRGHLETVLADIDRRLNELHAST